MPEAVITIPVACNRAGSQVGGLNKRDESVGFGGQYSPYMRNMVVEASRVRKRRGYSKLGTNLPLTGIGTGMFQYIDALGSDHLLAITSTSAYEYNPTTKEWESIYGLITLQDVDFTDVLDVDDTAIEQPGSSSSVISGSTNKFFGASVTDVLVFAANGGSALVISNDVDSLYYFEGEVGGYLKELVINYPSFSCSADVNEFWNHLVIAGITTSSADKKLIAWSDLGDAEDFTGGTSGAARLTDAIGNIHRAVKLGYDLIVYAESSISDCQYVGGSTIFSIPTPVLTVGLLSRAGIWSFGNYHCFLGSDLKTYRYFGGTQLDYIGALVDPALFSELNYDNRKMCVALHDPIQRKLHFFFPRSSDSYGRVSYSMATDLLGNPWEYHEFGHDVCAGAVLRATSTVYCDDTIWGEYYTDELDGYCDDAFGQSASPVCVFISSNGNVYVIDEKTGLDDDLTISAEYQTEDVTVDDEETFARWQWFAFTAMSSTSGSVYAQYSTDGGDSWTDFANSPVQLSVSWETYRLPLSVASRRIRFRLLQETIDDFQLRSSFKITASIDKAKD